MKMPPHSVAVATAMFLFASSCATPPNGDLANIIDANVAARGGATALENIRNIRTKVEIVEPTFAVTGDYRAKDGRMRIDIYADGARVFSEGVDDVGAWQQNGEGAPITESSASGRAALLHGIEFNLFGLHQLTDRGAALSIEGDENIDNVTFRGIKVRLADGFETYLYFNPATSMIERRRDVRALHPDVDPTTKLIENRYFDFRDFCGVLSPASSRQVDVISGTELQTTKIVSQECNLPEKALQLPRDAVTS